MLPKVAAAPRRLGLSSEDADPRSLLQSRLCLYHGVLFAFTGALFLVSWAFVAAIDAIAFEPPITYTFAFHALIVAATGGSWLALRRWRLGVDALQVIDAAVMGLTGLLTAGWAAIVAPAYRPELGTLLTSCQILFARAALVPSSPSRTAGVGAALLLPVLIADYCAYELGPTPPWLRPASAVVGMASAWAIIIVLLSAITSRVIYGLRRKVDQAMQLGQYTVERLIGRGGMGAVYLARHSLLRRPTAIKVLASEAAGDEAIARFEREVQTTSELTHPHTVAIYDYGRTPDACFYYAMEYLDGFDLESLVAVDGPQPPSRVVHILRQVCGALAEAHSRGLVHRDVKPANIMLCERGRRPDFVKVLDFGLVRAREAGSPELSRDDLMRGTPLYMAPEAIVTPGAVGASADIYAVGALAYFLLAGRPPFEAATPVEVMTRQLRDQPEPPSARSGVDLPPALEALVLACLEKSPAARPASMDELDEAFDALGVEPWSQSAARAWWRERAQSVRSAASRADTPAAPRLSIAVDLEGRRAAAGLETTAFTPIGPG
ncbi:MAG TPA: serine/threonine-protein kinase [Kofleriaceae bacterium]|nr:serine/threonine-protein kinase [Kofleriaceae bacterium]